MDNALAILKQEPLSVRCQNLTELLPTLPIRQLHMYLPQLLSNIFGYDSTPGWRLSSLHSNFHPTDFKAIRAFLKPNGGCLFKALQCLESDNSSHFLFPFNALPPNSVALLNDRAVPSLYRMFVNVDIESKELSMTAYHYYFMYFTYFLIHPPPGVVWPASLADVLYTQLVEDYLHFFLPPGNSIPNFGAAHPINRFVPNTYSLSQAFAEIMFEMWLNQRGNDTNKVVLSIDQVRIIRMLVKHTHRFVYTPHLVKDRYTEDITNYISSSFQSNTYQFLNYHFATWPLISSFRGLLETWLSYIQPWRYTSIVPGPLTDSNISEWQNFIRDNLPAYCNLLDRCLRRMSHSLICSGKNVTLLSRVLKIYSAPPLLRTICELERGNTHNIVNVFTEGEAAQELLDKLSGEIMHLEKQLSKSTPSVGQSAAASGLFGWISEGLWSQPDQQDAQQKTVDALRSSVSQLQTMFYISPNMETTSTCPSEQSGPDYVTDALHRRRLTPQGRERMVAGTLKRDLKDVTAECNPALRPICSYENPHLVRYLYKLSLSLSGKVARQLRVVHGSKGPIQSVLKPLVVQVKEDVSEEGALLLNLRPVASYRFIFYSALIFLLSYMSGINPLLIFTYLGLALAACAFASSIVTSS
ncbi:sphingomyelin phosphodiesterase 4-like isoform X2 [Bolinopsis microptera]|uniref:sphingomyelin phosphodiesterase 4-like isoform X2 n=1 Tax=Bolinopsis microptera TaxID=2820187 RepID=UPI003078D910